MQASDSQPSKKPSGLTSPTVISLQLAGWLVFACLWLPLCNGCSGGAAKTPIDFLKPVTLGHVRELFFNTLILGSYCNGLLVAISMGIVAWIANERLWRFFFFAQFGVTFTMATVLVVIGLAWSTDQRNLLETFLFTVPTLLAISFWIVRAIRRKDFQRAWARVQHAWMITAIFMIHMMILFEGSVLYGYWVTWVGQASLVIAVEIATYRMKHDLWDASQIVTRPQFAIGNILCWTAFFPLAFSYYQAIGPVCNWFFRP